MRIFKLNWKGTLRVALYVLVSLGLIGVWSARRVHAALGERVLALGNETLRLGVVDGDSNRLRVNGEELMLSLMTVEASVPEVLDRFQAACDSSAANLREVWTHLPKLSEQQRRALDASGMRIGSSAFRFQKDDAGVVLCFAEPGGRPAPTLLARLEAATSSADLSRLGALRYVSAQRTGKRTQLTILDSEHTLNLERLVGEGTTGDVAGVDPINIERPPGSRRAFSVSVVNTPYAYNLYETKELPAAVLARYDRRMREQGFERLEEPGIDEPEQRVYIKPMLMVIATATRSEEFTVVSLLETSRNPPDSGETSPRARVE